MNALIPFDGFSQSRLERRRNLESKLPLSLRRVQATVISNQPLERCPGLALTFCFLFDCELANLVGEPPPVILDAQMNWVETRGREQRHFKDF